MCVRVLIIDDQPRARHSLAALLTAMRWGTVNETGYVAPETPFAVEIVGEAEHGRQAVEQVQALHPDVIVLDLNTSSAEPGPGSLSEIRMIKHAWPAIRIVVLTMYATDRAAVLSAGADAFLLKGGPISELLEAVLPGLRPGAR